MFSRNHQTPYVIRIGPLTPEHMLALRDRSAAAGRLQRLRDSHHNVCRLAALGLSTADIAARTGYSTARISQLLNNNPAIQDQIARYRGEVNASWRESVGEYASLGTSNMMKAERQIADRLDMADEADDPLPIRELIAIARDAADRFGYGKRTTNLNINVDFAARLEAARLRSSKVIEGEKTNAA